MDKKQPKEHAFVRGKGKVFKWQPTDVVTGSSSAGEDGHVLGKNRLTW